MRPVEFFSCVYIKSARPQFCLLQIVHTEIDMARFDWFLYTLIFEGKSNITIIYPKSYVECKYSVFDGQINDNNYPKAALGMKLGLVCRNL